MRSAISVLSLLLLATVGGCPLMVTEDVPDAGAVDADGAAPVCADAPNCQGCPPLAPGRMTADGWCLDVMFIAQMHPGADTCYRGYGEYEGRQCCYDSDGCLIGDDDVPAAGTPDFVGPATAELADGSCDWFRDPGRVIAHWFFDVFLESHGIVLGCCPIQ